MNENSNRWDEIRKIHIESASAYHVLGGLVLVGLGIWIGAHLFAGDSGFGSNIYAEFIGIVAAYFIIDFLNRKSEDRRRTRELKDRLLREARSSEPGIARYAFHEMQDRGLMYGEESILRGAFLSETKPVKVDLNFARLDGSYLMESDFSKSSFLMANLDNTNLSNAKLHNAFFREARLRNADLEGADLANADLVGADLTGANLSNANLESSRLFIEYLFVPEEAQDDPNVYKQLILPDGTTVTGDVDMSRFTNPQHDGFWRSTSPQSPACVDHQKRFEYVVSSLLKGQG